VAKLLVSVRSGVEALAALAGGAAIIDVKEPRHGSLGRAPVAVWRQVREVVPGPIPVSVALGELNDWLGAQPVEIPRGAWTGVAFRKLGLSDASPDWIDRWRRLGRHLSDSTSSGTAWVAVVYVDWQAARAPEPDAIIRALGAIDDCRGVLFDTWDKSRCSGIDLTWASHVAHVRDSGRFVALAGSLDVDAIGRLAPLEPDIFAVRGAACAGGDRLGQIDTERVSLLTQAAGPDPCGPFRSSLGHVDHQVMWKPN
jgi:(5-formylfuran-3-yl)methyl phosphate synthase